MKIVLKCFLCLVPAIVTAKQAADVLKNPFGSDPAAVTAGKKLFDQTCQACHGADARGDRGPALAAGKFQQGGEDDQIFSNIRNGIKGTQMPAFPNLPSDNIWQIITYIRSLGEAAPRANEHAEGDPRAGQALFFGKAKCNSCHQVNERGTSVGPDLSEAGKNSITYLREVIVDPGKVSRRDGERVFRRGPAAVSIKTKDGTELRGMRLSEDTYALVFTDLNGKLHFFDRRDVEETALPGLMPAYGTQLSHDEIDNLVAYLHDLKTRDLSQTTQADLKGSLTFDRLRNAGAEPQNWLTYWGDYQGHHFSKLKEITTGNVARLQAKWAVQMPGDSVLEAMPLVIDRIMYTSGPPGDYYALDAKTGLQIWKYQRKQKVVNPYQINPFNRGVAVEGGRVFLGTLDAALIALDARTGLPVWEHQVADTMLGYTITSAPLVVNGKVMVGVSGGEFGAPGFLEAYDAATGKKLWRFDAVPKPGEFGSETWAGDSWKRGGAPAWLTGSYDPETDTLYWGIGNPGPDLNSTVRPGDNLFSCSVVALDATTGKRKWHYQFSPGDSHDWDATEDMVLVDRTFHGEKRSLLLQANRNGFFYVLDRSTGKFLQAKAYVRQTWNKGFDENGRPIVIPNTGSSPEGTFVYPGLGGGSNWQAPSYNSDNGLLYIAFHDSGMEFVSLDEKFEPGKIFFGRGRGTGKNVPKGDKPVAGVRALDPETGQMKWEYRIAGPQSLAAGVLATSGGLVFSSTAEGNIIGLDATTGKDLWHFQTGAGISSSPISYAVDGKQFISVAAGNVLYSFALPD